MTKRRSLLVFLTLGLFLTSLILVSSPVYAASFVVNVTADTNDGVCTINHCSLREAIIAANAAPGSTVEIPPGTYTLSIAGTNEDAAATGDLDITANMTIQGIDPNTTIIDANQIDRVFHITGNFTVNFYNLTVQKGKTVFITYPSYEGYGGGILNQGGILNLTNSVVTSNTGDSGGGISSPSGIGTVNIISTAISNNVIEPAPGVEGGAAIYMGGGGALSIVDSIISANISTPRGTGGLKSYATSATITRTVFSNNVGSAMQVGGNVTVLDSTFSNNVSNPVFPAPTPPGGLISAGAILNFGNLIVTRSNFVGNSTTANGGAINAWRGTTQITNSTFSGNSAAKGGTVNNAEATDEQGTSTTTITNSTFFGNTATSGIGSSIYSDTDGSVTIRANIFANGTGSACAANPGGSLTSTGYNLSGDSSCSTYLIATGDQNSVNPLLGALQNNGGYTSTHALQGGSPAIDAIPVGNCTLATDQRGILRPQGSACDIGAFESEPGTIQTGSTFTVNVTNDNNGSCTDIDCSLREAINAANANSDTSTIAFSISGGSHTIQPLAPLPIITNPVVIDGTTQSGYAVGAPVIEINGSSAVTGSPVPHIDLVGINIVGVSNNTVRGLIINGWGYGGIGMLNSSNNVVEGNFIGTNAAGTSAVPNLYGVIIYNGSNNRVGGTTAAQRNVISGNNDDGVNIGGQTSAQAVANIVQGNYIGTTAAGTAALGNNDDGVKVEIADGTIIGGTAADARNIIAANAHNGVILKGVGTIHSLVQGNFIGTDVNGTAALGNMEAGVRIEASSNNTVGGSLAEARNLISGNSRSGILLVTNATANSIEGNYIGTDITGMTAIGNGTAASGTTNNNGIETDATSSGNTIGGTNPASRNVISGNAKTGVWLNS